MLKFDENGFDQNGFNINGIHKDTGTRFDKEGYDQQGYDDFGLNKYGFTRDGHSVITDKEGNKTIVFATITTRMLSPKGDTTYNKDGVNSRGFFYGGKNVLCLKEDATLGDRLAIHDRRGFLEDGTHIETGTKYNKYGYDAYGRNEDGYDEYGFNKDGINEYTGSKLDPFGNDFVQARAYMRRNLKLPEGLDKNGFDENGLWNGTSKFSKETGLDIDGYDKNGFNLDGINRRGFKRDGIHNETNTEYDLDGYDVLGIDKDGKNKQTHEKDERVLFVEEFIRSGKTIEAFAKDKGMGPNEVERKLEEMKSSPCVSTQISQALEKNSDKFLATANSIKTRLISGQMDIKEVRDIDTILRLGSDDERAKIMSILVKRAANHDISILEYKSIFGFKGFGSELPQNIMNKLDELTTYAKRSGNKELTAITRDVYKEKERVKGYKSPYKPEDLKSVGYMEEGKKEPTTLTITDEHIEMAKQYLHATGEYICYKTMSSAFMKIAKGELTQESLNKLVESKSKEDEKQELIESILNKQQHIADQNSEITRLESQRGQDASER